ncbi:MAG: hypothetical protein JWP85_2211 [Rhodoglobus sp.]|nr:hypothetical protein [Rhodoglobus sp.]
MTIEDAAPGTLRPRHNRPGPVGGIVIALAMLVNIAIVVAVVWIATNQQRVVDQLAVWRFEPTAQLETYVERSTMTDEGRFLFYASRPEIAPEGAFDRVCSSRLEDVGILGCYLPGNRTIFLYDVTDDRLDGIEEVVAAHEMLHAAWDRMSEGERSALGPLLEAEAAKRADDAAFAETLAFYAKAEPGERLNELHSIIGTEFTEVGPELEAHYALYFTDRAAVTALHEKSNGVFVEQGKAIEALVARIDTLTAAIDADYASYNAGYDQLNADIDAFNARAESGDVIPVSQFNAERNELLRRQADLEALYATIDARHTEYVGLVAQLDDLNAQVDELNQSINIEPRAPQVP